MIREYYIRILSRKTGSHQIEIHKLINSLMCWQIFKTGRNCSDVKDTYKITTPTGQCVGEATVYLRASCLGTKIVTQFQIPEDKRPYLFKGADEGPIFQCKRISDRKRVECVCSAEKIDDGSGEAARSCCPTVSMADKRRGRREIEKDKCPPCCPTTGDSVKSVPAIRKCGCVVKEDRTCSCTRPNIKRL